MPLLLVVFVYDQCADVLFVYIEVCVCACICTHESVCVCKAANHYAFCNIYHAHVHCIML